MSSTGQTPGSPAELRSTPLPYQGSIGPPRDPSRGQRRKFEPRAVIYREGEPLNQLFRIRRGTVKLIRHLPNGRARIVRLQTPGALLGLSTFCAGGHLQAHTAVAIDHVEAELLPRSYLCWLRQDHPDRYLELLEELGGKLRQADLWITELSTGTIRNRVARLLRFLDEIQTDRPAGEMELFTCQEMGEILGVTPESVSRIIAELKRQGVLDEVGGSGERYRCHRRALEVVALD